MGFVYNLSHNYYLDIGCDVYFRSPSGDGVDFLSRTISTTVVVSDWYIIHLTHSWWVSIRSIVGIIREVEKETVPSAIHCGSDQLAA